MHTNNEPPDRMTFFCMTSNHVPGWNTTDNINAVARVPRDIFQNTPDRSGPLQTIYIDLWPLLLTWFNFNHSMDK